MIGENPTEKQEPEDDEDDETEQSLSYSLASTKTSCKNP